MGSSHNPRQIALTRYNPQSSAHPAMPPISFTGGKVAVIFIVGFMLSAAVIWLLLRTKLAWRIAMDIPNERSLHNAPTPRAGGWGLVPAAVVAACALGVADWLLAGVAALLFAVSYIDDRIGLPIMIRLPMQAAAAALWLALGPVEVPIAVAALATFAIVWITNLFNFMDGADGLAGGMAFFAFSAYAAVAAAAGLTPLAAWSVALAGASAGFLLFNFNPAKVFLGDAGSVTVGFLAGAFGIWGWAAHAWPVWFPFLVSAPFFLDATVTILRRMFSGEAFWRAHREHYYQRLIRSGWSHRRTALCEYLLMGAGAVLAIAMLSWSTAAQYVALACVAMVYFGLAYAIDRRWAVFQATSSETRAAQAGYASSIAVPVLQEQSAGPNIRSPDAYVREPMSRSNRVGDLSGSVHHEHTPQGRFDESTFSRDADTTASQER